MAHPRSDRLHEQPHRLSRDRRKAFHPQHIEGFGDARDARREAGRVGDLGQRHDKTIEVVVVMFGFEIVMGAAVLDVVLGGEAEPEQHRGVDLALGDAARP